MDFSAIRANLFGHMFPQLTRTQFWIEKLLDERGLCFFLRGSTFLRACGEALLEKVRDDCPERETFDSLRSPFCADLIAGHSPHFFGVGLEERQIKLPSETVDEEIFQRLFFPLRQE